MNEWHGYERLENEYWQDKDREMSVSVDQFVNSKKFSCSACRIEV